MKNPFRRTKIAHPDGLDSTFYVQGYVFTGGAESLAYINTRPHPLITTFAGFIPSQQLRVTNPQTVYQFNALPVQPLIAGVRAGQIISQGLTTPGELHGSPNDTLLDHAFFGGN